MPFLKKAQVVVAPVGTFQKQLEYLYARRIAIDALIESLQQYDRFRATAPSDGNRKSA